MADVEVLKEEVVTFLLVLLRLGLVMTFLPVTGSRSLPAQFKIGLIVALALVLTPAVDLRYDENDIPLLVVKELFFSLALAFTVRVVFYAIDTAGQIISTTMGLSLATVFNPEMGQSTAVTSLYSVVAIMLFLSLDAHHYFIYAFVKSFERVPLGGADVRTLSAAVLGLSGRILVIALKMAAPVITVVMMTNILLGLVQKLMPQFNIFFVGWPVYLSLGYLIMFLGIPLTLYLLGGYFTTLKDDLDALILIGE